MQDVDSLHGAPGLTDTTSTPAGADVVSAASGQAATVAQETADASAEAERLLRDLCGIKMPLLKQLPLRPARPRVS
jgi:hypothetical protein